MSAAVYTNDTLTQYSSTILRLLTNNVVTYALTKCVLSEWNNYYNHCIAHETSKNALFFLEEKDQVPWIGMFTTILTWIKVLLLFQITTIYSSSSLVDTPLSTQTISGNIFIHLHYITSSKTHTKTYH